MDWLTGTKASGRTYKTKHRGHKFDKAHDNNEIKPFLQQKPKIIEHVLHYLVSGFEKTMPPLQPSHIIFTDVDVVYVNACCPAVYAVHIHPSLASSASHLVLFHLKKIYWSQLFHWSPMPTTIRCSWRVSKAKHYFQTIRYIGSLVRAPTFFIN